MPGKVENDLDTIDGREQRLGSASVAASPRAPARSEPPAPQARAPVDYPELIAVERRHYAISGEIAQGGMGRVLAARDLRLGRPVAIKELLPRNRDLARRFEREARITARLQHPAIIHIYEAGVWTGGDPFYAMTRVSGRSLDKVVAELPTLNERLGLLPNVIAVVDALAYAHNERVIHRDIKPANVLVGEFGETVVIDWGLAKDLGTPDDVMPSAPLRIDPVDSEAGSVVGTPAYMPPEQARGECVDQRADVYALGAVLYYTLAGKPPYSGASADEVLHQVKAAPCAPVHHREPGVPPDLIAIVAKAMARDPADRYDNARELAQDLKRFQTGQLVAARHYTTFQLLARWLRRRRLAVSVAAVAAIVLIAGSVISISQILDDQRRDQLRRDVLLEDRGRTELLAGHDGRALVYLVGAAHGATRGALGFMIADASRPFDAQLAAMPMGDRGKVVVAYSPDGKLVAAAGSGAVQIWDGKLRAAPLGDVPGLTRVIAFDRGSQRVVTAGDDGIARVWPLRGGAPQLLVGHDGPIIDAVFSDDGTRLATASGDGTARVWNLATGEAIVSSCHRGPVVSVRFSPDGDSVATASEDFTACVWATSTGDTISPLRGHSAAVHTARWSPDGRRVLTASADGTARIWDAVLGKPVVKPLAHDPGTHVATAEFSSDGQRVLTAGSDHTARVWRLPTARSESATLPSATLAATFIGHAGGINAAVFSADDARVATAGEDNLAKIWDAATGQPLRSFEHGGVVATLAFDRDRSRLVTGSRDGTTRVWDLASGDEGTSIEVDSPIHAVAVARDGAIAAGRDDTKVTLVRGQMLPPMVDHVSPVHAVGFSADGSQLITAGDDGVFVSVAGAPRRRLAHGHPVRALAISAAGDVVATACEDGHARLWSIATGEKLRDAIHAMPLTAVALAPVGGLVVALDDAGETVIWRDAVPIEHRKRTQSPARALAFNHAGTRLVIAGATDARIFKVERDAVAPSSTVALDGPLQDVRAVVFAGDDSRVITGGGDGLAKVWDAEKGKLIGIRSAQGTAINSLAISADGNTLWAGCESRDQGFVRSWDIHVEARGAGELRALLQRVPWRLDDDDVVRLTNEPRGRDEQR